MVNHFIYSICFLTIAFFCEAQVAINEDQSNPSAGSILDVKSTNKGILIPRMASNPTTPLTGMFYYNTSINMFKYYNGSSWEIISAPWRYNEANGAVWIHFQNSVGIGTNVPKYGFEVGGNGGIGTNLHVGRSLLINEPTVNATLTLKGTTNYGDWGQHIILENAANTDYGGILHDGGGMKFRNFGAGDGYFFRDINNANLLQISSTGNVTASGNVTAGGNVVSGGNMQVQGSATVNGGKGVVSNASGATNLKIHQFTVSNNNVTLNGGASQGFNIQFEGGFTSTPQVFAGDIDSQTTIYTNQEFGWLVLTIRGCLLNTTTGITTCAAKIINTQNDNFYGTIRWNCMAIGF